MIEQSSSNSSPNRRILTSRSASKTRPMAVAPPPSNLSRSGPSNSNGNRMLISTSLTNESNLMSRNIEQLLAHKLALKANQASSSANRIIHSNGHQKPFGCVAQSECKAVEQRHQQSQQQHRHHQQHQQQQVLHEEQSRPAALSSSSTASLTAVTNNSSCFVESNKLKSNNLFTTTDHNNNNNNNNNLNRNLQMDNFAAAAAQASALAEFDSNVKKSRACSSLENSMNVGVSATSSNSGSGSAPSSLSAVKYGELVVLGYNGCILNGIGSGSGGGGGGSSTDNHLQQGSHMSSRRKSKFSLKARDRPNNVKPVAQYSCQSNQEINNVMCKNANHSVTYTLSRNHTVVVKYDHDETTDMFQIGRSSEPAIDFIVLDTHAAAAAADTTAASASASAAAAPFVSQAQPPKAFASRQPHPQAPPLPPPPPPPLPPTQTSSPSPAVSQSTISRFACRITVERNHPYTARIYAAGFDSSKSIFLGEKATKWRNVKGELDGVTTNGVLIMHPTKAFAGGGDKRAAGEWLEVSVCGAVFSLSDSRLMSYQNGAGADLKLMAAASNTSNILHDGTLIDLCGAALLWRSREGLEQTANKQYIEHNLAHLNRLRPQCPVGLKTLLFPSSASPLAQLSAHLAAAAAAKCTGCTGGSVSQQQERRLQLQQQQQKQQLQQQHELIQKLIDRMPMVYLKCGHVHGHHNWGVKKDNERECPLCRKVGPYVQLIIGLEPSLYCDLNNNSKTAAAANNSADSSVCLFRPYAFRPCGHMSSEVTCKYWSRMMLPQGSAHGTVSLCPFCAVPLCREQPYVKLIFQEGF